jgi:hypothetical protein
MAVILNGTDGAAGRYGYGYRNGYAYGYRYGYGSKRYGYGSYYGSENSDR